MIRRISLIGLALFFILVFISATGGEDQFVFLEELRPGMEGTGKTVVRGDEIRTFQVRIVDIMDNPGDLNDHIVIRASGDAIEESGGISAGMSGSPIYINGKLIGAIWGAAAFDVSPEPIALVRPIESMLKLVDLVRERIEEKAEAESEPKEHLGERATDQLKLLERYRIQRLSAPVWVSGLSGRAFRSLKEGVDPQIIAANRGSLLSIEGIVGTDNFLSELQLGLGERYDLTFYQVGVEARGTESYLRSFAAKLEPGSAIGALLTTGDVSIGSFGTLTYEEGDILLAFGHSFLLGGGSDLFLTSIKVLDTVQSLQVPFKLGVPGRRLGAILQDRFQGIAGAIGVDPESVSVDAAVKDNDLGAKRSFDVDMIDDPKLLPSLLYSSILEMIDESLNRIGEGTLKVEYEIEGEGLPEKLEREDIFYSFSDIAVSAPLQIAQVVYLLAWNEFADPKINEIEVDISVDKEVRVYEMASLETDKETYNPGDLLNYTVTLKPFRGDQTKLEGSLKIPEDLEKKRLTLHAFGGPQSSQDMEEEAPKFESLQELVEAIERVESNDQLTVELLGIPEDIQEELDREGITDIQKLKDWVVLGEENTQVNIEIPEEEEKEEQPQEEEEEKPEEEQKCDQLFYCE